MITPMPIPMPVNTSSDSGTRLIFSTPMNIIGIAILVIFIISAFVCVLCCLLDAVFDLDVDAAMKIAVVPFIASVGVGIIYLILLLCGVGVTTGG